MGRIFQHIDINGDFVAKRVVTNAKHGGHCPSKSANIRLESPTNTTKLPVQTSYGLYAGRNGKPHSSHSIMDSSGRNCCSIEAPIKKLINEEISKRSNTRQNAPSIVARLMGIDMLPVDLGQAPKMVGKKNETPTEKLIGRKRSENGPVCHDPYIMNSSPLCDLHSIDPYFDSCSDQCRSHRKLRKPKRREHPQEEELQKFKKEFEAWQAARFMECSKVVEYGNAPNHLIAQDKRNNETTSLYGNSRRTKTCVNLMEPKDLSVRPHEMLTSCNWGEKKGYLFDGMRESLYSNQRSRTSDIQHSQLIKSDPNLDIVSAPTKIVILRPGPDRIGVSEDSWNSTPSTFDERGNILDFLEEVKERLKAELQGKSSKKSTTVRGGGIETPYRERPSEPKQIAQRIAQEVRDSVTRDLGMNLLRSESTRSYRSDTLLNGTSSPEFINRDTRRILTERLRNVLKGEIHREFPTVAHRRLRSSVLDYENSNGGYSRDLWSEDKNGCCERFTNDTENHSRSFREDPDDGGMHYKEPSPGSLVRSLSAPVSGTSFGKLLLEDRHILTGAQIRMKHEFIENVSLNVKKQRKDKFNIREKVSSFGYSLTLRGRLFRRRVQSVDELHYNRDDLLKDIASGPTVMMSSCETHENSTEVPPSPASVCSSACEEFWRPAAFSSPMSLGVNQLQDSEKPDLFSQINSNLNDLRQQLNQLDCIGVEESVIEEQQHEVAADIDDPAEAYVRDLLVASGYYENSCNRSLSKWARLGKPISNQVFEEVEESYRQSTEVEESCSKAQEAITRRMILDLLNEALPTILRGPRNISRSGRAVPCLDKPLHGRALLLSSWEIIRFYVHPPDDRSYYALDSMLARDLKSDLWSRSMDDEIEALGKDLECRITDDLIEEIIKDLYL